MASRVTTQQVAEFMALAASFPVDSLTEHVKMATLIVDEDLASKGLTDARLEAIELNLAAHFAILGIERGGLTRYQVGESSESYKEGSNSDRGYILTRYGQQAISLDNSGTLVNQATPMKHAQFRVV